MAALFAMDNLTGTWKRRLEFAAFVSDSVSKEETQAICRRISRIPHVAECEFVSSETAWPAFKEEMGFGSDWSEFDEGVTVTESLGLDEGWDEVSPAAEAAEPAPEADWEMEAEPKIAVAETTPIDEDGPVVRRGAPEPAGDEGPVDFDVSEPAPPPAKAEAAGGTGVTKEEWLEDQGEVQNALVRLKELYLQKS